MIHSVTVTNYRGESIELDLQNPDESGFIVASITGLGPGKADINTTETSTSDGGLYNSARLPSRNIVISLFYTWKDSIEDVRQLSYRYFPIKRKVTLLFKTDNRTAEIDGYVESNDPNIFSSFEGAQISIICPDPYFHSLEDQTTMFSGVLPSFEFPFSNESLTTDVIEMGRILNRFENLIVYNGDSEVGINIVMHALGEATNIRIWNLDTSESLYLDTNKIAKYTGSGIKYGDDIVISTVQGQKSVKLVREGKTYNILNCLGKNPKWLRLSKGNNYFAYTADTGAVNLQFTITNKVIYEGV